MQKVNWDQRSQDATIAFAGAEQVCEGCIVDLEHEGTRVSVRVQGQDGQAWTGEITGFLFERDSASATLDQVGNWAVDANLTDEGVSIFNSVATTCSSQSATCPTGLVALVMDESVSAEHEHYRLLALSQRSEMGERPHAKVAFAGGDVEHHAESDGNGPVDDYVSFTPLGEPRRLSGALQMGTFSVCRPGQDEVQVVLAATGRVRTVRTRTRCPG